MKILLSWLKDFVNLKEDNITEITQRLTDLGLEVEGISKIESIPGSLEGLIVGEIISCYKHPNADRLHCTTVNIGENKNVNIVCGAPNVREGLKCIVALPNTCIHTIKGEDIIIKETKIRGVISSGMLCAGDEVGINEEHEGIFELTNEAKVGTKVSSYFKIKNDFVIDISITPNRGYALSHIGIARDLAAATNIEVTPPKNYSELEKASTMHEIIIEDEGLCKNFAMIIIKNIKITSSPEWIKERLLLVGIKPKNNIVDITNYIMLAYGQPMHAYNLNSIKGNVRIRQASKGEKFKALNNKEYILDEDIVVCDEKKVLSLAGIIGGESSCITDDTTDILLESACFDHSKIRLSCQKLGLRTEASYRFERGIDPTMQEYCLHAASELLHEQQNNIEVIGIKSIQNKKLKQKEIKLSFQYINSKIGQSFDKNEIIDILHRLDFETSCTEDNITCLVPAYRENVQYPSDVVEEILRLKGFESINSMQNKNIFPLKHNRNKEVARKEKIINMITDFLVNRSFYETISSPLLSTNVENAIKIINPSGVNDTLRTEIITSGLQLVKRNINLGNKNLKFFEVGKIYMKDNEEYKEEEHLSIFISGEGERTWQGETGKSSYFKIKEIVLSILELLHVGYKEEEDETDNNKTIIKKRGLQIAEYGFINTKVLQNLDINQDIFFADLNLKNLILQSEENLKKQFKSICNYPITKREISFAFDKKIRYEDIIQKIKTSGIENMTEIKLLDVYNNENKLGINKKAYSFFFSFQASDHTLTEEEINKNVDLIINIMNKTFNAQLRGIKI